METQIALIEAFSSSALLGLVSHILFFTILNRGSVEFRSSEFTGQSVTGIPWSFNQELVFGTRILCLSPLHPDLLEIQCKVSQSVVVWGAMSSADVDLLCFLRAKVSAAIYQEVEFIFQQDMAPAHTAKSTNSWLKIMVFL